jgi:voltage-gated potassium channel Kch
LAVCFAGLYRVVGVDFGANETVLSPLYFSVVTLTTLGYGDILPTTMAGQVAVMVETVLGYVMLGGLLAMFSSTVARRS